MIRLLSAPFDGCGRRAGSRMGPAALHMAGLSGMLRGIGLDVESRGVFPPEREPYGPPEESEGQRLDAFFAASAALKVAVAEAIREDAVPVVLGGDHSLAIASAGAAVEAANGELALIWIDAHLDLNTLATSPTRNLHGMPVAALMGLEDPDPLWQRIQSELAPEPRLRGSQAAWFGVRDVDQGEVRNYRALSGASLHTMEDIDGQGCPACIDQLLAWLEKRPGLKVWVSFDVDSIDPFFAPGTGTAVRGGLTEREAFLLAERLGTHLEAGRVGSRLIGMDIVEVNPLADRNNETALIAGKWAEAFFGRRIMSLHAGAGR